jgi:hypothetical protein
VFSARWTGEIGIPICVSKNVTLGIGNGCLRSGNCVMRRDFLNSNW